MRYLIGVDLGTTNSAVSYVDMTHPSRPIQQFHIPQWIKEGVREQQMILPSFLYRDEKASYAGVFAREQGAKIPTRLVHSAKSWLCLSTINRRDKILPPEAVSEDIRISPVEASAYFLRHIKEAWNQQMSKGNPDWEWEQQEIILTVPASFDEVARALTVEAAQMAGFNPLTLLEEPQAAFYSWIAQHEKVWEEKLLKAGDHILVCDIGGGTTDFSVIEVAQNEEKLSFQRVAVGDHLLLGGDNMDIALAHLLESRLNIQATPHQWLQLRHQGRYAKESLLGEKAPERVKVVIQGEGSKVIQGSLVNELSREEVENFLMEGFFKELPWNEAILLNRSSGFKTMGLPFEEDPSITKHLASFLAHYAPGISPEYILFNGGTMKPLKFQQAILHSLSRWFPNKMVTLLTTQSLDLAVAKGAAYYGKARKGLGIRVSGGSARTLYTAVETPEGVKALTLLCRGSEEGAIYESSYRFHVTPNTPISFQLYTSHVRLHDQKGEIIEIDPLELHPLPPLFTVLKYGKTQEKFPVYLQASLTEIGTLDLKLKTPHSDHEWKLEFQLRPTSKERARQDELFEEQYLHSAGEALRAFFLENKKTHTLMEEMESILEKPRREWPPSLLRKLWDTLLNCFATQNFSPETEARWWNLAGFLLRPGYGYPIDDFRIKELWKIILSEQKKSKAFEIQIQKWICYRRIAGGLTQGQQRQLANELLPLIINKKTGKIELKSQSERYAYSEKIRTLAAFELMDIPLKINVGNAIMMRILSEEATGADYWALGRLGARQLLHGAFTHVVPAQTCILWLEKLHLCKGLKGKDLGFLLHQFTRQSDHRELNLSQDFIKRIFENVDYQEFKEERADTRTLTFAEREQVYGERLPLGLILD